MYLHNSSSSWINDPKLFVFASSGNQRAIVVPRNGVDQVREDGAVHDLLAIGRVPQDDVWVTPTGQQNVGRTGMPQQELHLATVCVCRGGGGGGYSVPLCKGICRNMSQCRNCLVHCPEQSLLQC